MHNWLLGASLIQLKYTNWCHLLAWNWSFCSLDSGRREEKEEGEAGLSAFHSRAISLTVPWPGMIFLQIITKSSLPTLRRPHPTLLLALPPKQPSIL